jgi:VanZ family protein
LGPLLHWLFPDIAPEQVSLVQFAIRKLGHWVEYFILSALLLQAFHGESKYKPSFRSMAWTLALMFIYAVGDELHQSFVPNRSAGIDDVMIDTFGGACGALWMYRRLRRR